MPTATKKAAKTCTACAFWNETDSKAGECRRHAPETIVFEVDDEVRFESRFPATKATDWCGEFKAK